MLINLLAPPYGDHPDVSTACSYATPGGGRLYIGLIAEEERLAAWRANRDMEVWETSRTKASMRVHLYGEMDFEAFREICTSLSLEGIGLLQVAGQGEHTIVLLASEEEERMEHSAPELTMKLRPIAERVGVDVAVTPVPPSPRLSEPGLLFMDMDSTLITCECIDEIGDMLGIKAEIADITRRAMEGELDFAESLTERVRLLAGLDARLLERVYEERVRLNDGAERLVETLRHHHWRVGLVSGGFTFFTERLREQLRLDFVLANELEIEAGKLTGRVLGDIVDARAKRRALLAQAQAWDIPTAQTVALGDGANDLPMLEAAGMGIAFRAKPKVRELAPYAISHGGLDRTLDLLS